MFRQRPAFVALLFTGFGFALACASTGSWRAEAAAVRDDKLRHPLRIRLYRYELNPGKAGRFDEWMKFLGDHKREAIESLERERMYVEGIFRDREHDKEVVYWLAIDGEGGRTVDDSPLDVDKEHMKFLREVIKKDGRKELAGESSLVAPFVLDAIRAQQQARQGD